MMGRVIEEHVGAAHRALFALEMALDGLDERIGKARAAELVKRTYALRKALVDIGDAARIELNATAPEPSVTPKEEP